MTAEQLKLEWDETYRALVGAFDTPIARRRDDSELAKDARERLRMFNERMQALTTGDTNV